MTESRVHGSWADEADREEAQRTGSNGAAPGADAGAHPPPQDSDDDSAPPPGFEAAAGADALAASLAGVSVAGGAADEPEAPDPAAPSGQGLQEPPEREITVQSNTPYTSAATFDELPLSEELKRGLYVEMKFERPSRIQAVTLPMVLTPPFRNLIAQAHNGSGKTTCFVLAMLSRVDPSLQQPQALCVCPTRELVVQNLAVLQRVGKFTNLSATSTAAAELENTRLVRITEQIIIGTHGKLKNWISKRVLPIKFMKLLVFDEADEMLKADGFASDSMRLIRDIHNATRNLQILLFSATFNDKVKNFATKVVKDANLVFVPKEELSLDVIKQYNVKVPRYEDKIAVLRDTIFPLCDKLGQTIIFVRTRDTARRLHSAMELAGHKCTSIQGDMDKAARDRVVDEFRSGATKILIATDVLARGFDVNQVTLVVNYDPPVERDLHRPAFETYLHRIGRSGRFGRKGAAFNLITGPAEENVMQAIADYFQRQIPEVPWDNEDTFEEALVAAGLMNTAS